jgi:hypothetical protein
VQWQPYAIMAACKQCENEPVVEGGGCLSSVVPKAFKEMGRKGT